MRLLLCAVVPLGLLAFAACGSSINNNATGTTGDTSSTMSTAGTGGGTTASSATATTSSTSSGAGGGTHGDCLTDADCNGKMCAPVTQGGYLVCIDPIPETTSCNSTDPPNECCTSTECEHGGGCYAAAQLDFCGGALPNFNDCVADQCASDADCAANTLCAPAGAFGYPKRFCLTAYCHTDADCKARPGGACVPVGYDPCCSLHMPQGLGCAYPDTCQKNSDCASNGQCVLDTDKGETKCGPPAQGCPP